MDTKEDKFNALRKGLLEFLVLKVVSANKSYAAEILEKLAGTDFKTQEGTLYPLLSKMRREAVLDYEWVESDQGPPRKYYRLTERGRQALKEFEDYWKDITATITTLGT